MPPSFILASGSLRRRELLASLGIEFTVIKTDVDESRHEGEAPIDYVRRLSLEKAAAAVSMVETKNDLTVVAADTIVILDGEILGKPEDADEARTMLHLLRNRSHTVCTALTLMCRDRRGVPLVVSPLTEHICTTVTMRDYDDDEIEAYIATGDPFDKAGGYAIQHNGFHPVARIEGSYSNVVGLPLEMLQEMLNRLR
jgi:septum formation protein